MKMEYAGFPWVELASLGGGKVDLPEGSIVEFDNGKRHIVGGITGISYHGNGVWVSEDATSEDVSYSPLRYQLPPWSE